MKVVGRLLGPPHSIDKTTLINKVRRRQRSGIFEILFRKSVTEKGCESSI